MKAHFSNSLLGMLLLLVAWEGLALKNPRGKGFYLVAFNLGMLLLLVAWEGLALKNPRGKGFNLVAFNIGKLKAPRGILDPVINEFESALAPINELATVSDGFVWQLNMDDPEERQNTGVRALDDDPLLIPQLSLWTSSGALHHYVIKSGHGSYLKRRKEW
jgi:hypothetical protein